MDKESAEISSVLPRRFQDMTEDDVNAIRLANQMFTRHGYYMAMYHCTTLMIHCHLRDREKRLILEDIAFWFKVRDIIQKRKP